MWAVKTAAETVTRQSDANGVLVIPPNENRVAIILDSPAARTTLISIGAGFTNLQGLTLAAANPPMVLSAHDFGRGIGDAITLQDSAGAQQTYTYTQFLIVK